MFRNSKSFQQRLSAMLALAIGFAGAVQAGTIYWDSGTAVNPGLGWGTAANWSSVSTDVTPDPGAAPTNTDDVIFNITPSNSVAGGPVNINLSSANQAVQSLTFNNTNGTQFFANSSAITTARTLTIGAGGITMNAGAGNVLLGAASGSYGAVNVTLGAAQGWTNNAAVGTLSLVDNNSTAGTLNYPLIIAGSGNTVIGNSTTVGASLTGNGGITKTGSGTLTVNDCGNTDRWHIGNGNGGDFTLQDGTLTVTPRYFVLYDNTATSGNYTQTGGTATHTPPTDTIGYGVYVGYLPSTSGQSGTFAISGGSFTESGVNTAVYVGRAATASGTNFTGNLNIGGGSGSATFTVPTVHIGGSGANSFNTGNVNLITNGTLTTLRIDRPGGLAANLYFDGGTLQVSSSFTSGNTILSNVLTAAQIKNGGAIIDSNGKDMVIAQGFTNYAGHTGSLTKISSGMLRACLKKIVLAFSASVMAK